MDVELLRDVDTLLSTARESGLGNAGVRRVVWPLLLRVDPVNVPRLECERGKLHGYEAQVEKDVERSMYLVHRNSRAAMRLELRHIIDRVLVAGSPDLCYYQGFHDVVTTLLLVCRSTQLTECVVDRLARGPIRPMLGQDLSQVLLNGLFPILAAEDPQLHAFLVQSSVQPYFALPWVLTWFSHSVANFHTVCRLFDLFLASEPSMPLFVAAALVLWSKPHVMAVECEYSAVHSFYSKLFSDISLRLNVADGPDTTYLASLIDSDLERIIAHAVRMHRRHGARFKQGSPFGPSRMLERFPPVRIVALPRSAQKPLLALRYRFEGVRTRRMRRKRFVAFAVALAVAFVAVGWVWFVRQ